MASDPPCLLEEAKFSLSGNQWLVAVDGNLGYLSETYSNMGLLRSLMIGYKSTVL